MPAASSVSGHYAYGTGRRKTAVARVRLHQGEGVILINGKSPSEYFGRRDLEVIVTQPFRVTDTMGRYLGTIKVDGGGIAGQAGAVCHGIARALIESDPELRGPLKRAGLLTRDPREKERKKPGLVRARKAKQYTKR
ncbi:MAG TPA: 30S ribosomal protein S9 [Candidatus Dormibacteraeota bacterium]|nr:30S ribosomal protein S9 [Candidatus Dormibacteraeota bacterium]